MQKKTFPALIEYLHDMLSFVQKYCYSQKVDPQLTEKIILAAEEALVNVIHHGYTPDTMGEIEITCEDLSDRAGIKILIKDHGTPFNPVKEVFKRKQKSKAKPPSWDDTHIGGYGIYVYIEIMDRVEYKWVKDSNILCLIKYFK